ILRFEMISIRMTDGRRTGPKPKDPLLASPFQGEGPDQREGRDYALGSRPHFFLFSVTCSGVGCSVCWNAFTLKSSGASTVAWFSGISSLKTSGTAGSSKIACHGHSG